MIYNYMGEPAGSLLYGMALGVTNSPVFHVKHGTFVE